MERLSTLSLGYLKRDIEPPKKPEFAANPAFLRSYVGYYHPEGTRSQILAGLEWLLGGSRITTDGNALVSQPTFGRGRRLIPTSDTLFRHENDVTPSLVFTIDEDGRRVLLGDGYYAVRVPRWRVEVVRTTVFAGLLLIATIPIAVFAWLVGPTISSRLGRRVPASTRPSLAALKVTLALLPVACLCLPAVVLAPAREWGEANLWTRVTFLASWAVPVLSLVAVALGVGAALRGAGRWFVAYVTIVALSGLCLSAYMAASDWIGIRLWMY
jgi:hypothetical protein